VPVALGGLYPDKEMTCAQGKPMFWERKWTVGYNGGVTRFATGEIQYSASWESSSLVSQQHQDAATFGAPTTDGQRTWLTVARSGNVIGAGFNGREDRSYLRCGNPYQDGQPRGIVQQWFQCVSYQNSRRSDGYLRFDYNADAFPYSTISVTAAADSQTLATQTIVDPDGQLKAAGLVQYNPSYTKDIATADFAFRSAQLNLQTRYNMNYGELVWVTIGVNSEWYCNPTTVVPPA
jgi:hypothetical protein